MSFKAFFATFLILLTLSEHASAGILGRIFGGLRGRRGGGGFSQPMQQQPQFQDSEENAENEDEDADAEAVDEDTMRKSPARPSMAGRSQAADPTLSRPVQYINDGYGNTYRVVGGVMEKTEEQPAQQQTAAMPSNPNATFWFATPNTRYKLQNGLTLKASGYELLHGVDKGPYRLATEAEVTEKLAKYAEYRNMTPAQAEGTADKEIRDKYKWVIGFLDHYHGQHETPARDKDGFRPLSLIEQLRLKGPNQNIEKMYELGNGKKLVKIRFNRYGKDHRFAPQEAMNPRDYIEPGRLRNGFIDEEYFVMQERPEGQPTFSRVNMKLDAQKNPEFACTATVPFIGPVSQIHNPTYTMIPTSEGLTLNSPIINVAYGMMNKVLTLKPAVLDPKKNIVLEKALFKDDATREFCDVIQGIKPGTVPHAEFANSNKRPEAPTPSRVEQGHALDSF